MQITYDFSGKIVLVTGGGSGIGRASSEAFGAAGAIVAVADISEKNGLETVEAIRAAGGTAEFIFVDVSNEESVKAMIKSVVDTFGTLDIAHNNAGIEGNHIPLAELPSDNWRQVIDVDLTSVFYCLKAEIPEMMKNGGGAIVNTASASGLIGGYNLSVYTAAKHGVIGLTKAAAMDYANKGIRINSICPGAIDTPFIAALPKPLIDRVTFATPMDRLGQPREIAQSVLWLCSDASSYVTGHSLSVDGGVVLGGTGTRFDDLI
ncbi:SDR family oxidoreductase [Paraglaciecola chathamensis]|uniref:3-oxoacyl-[acyl-carrier-protein] reductase n=1 Tax=Paraglaciecola agarilytica NO2 TaxID=1125747 RepID=A0ABQ0IAW3_9ALTE|nr:SDR family oxidoreductase [Paraglaciecola agarilytica]GAC06445.1 3-oxoacyl-[acyl-carrier-protein] reductase [Paraglaciecola agarilytica NO2]